MNNWRSLYWNFFNFLTRRVMALGFVGVGIILSVSALPNLLPGGTVQDNGVPSDDIVLRTFSVVFPLIVSLLGVLLFRAKPFYPPWLK